MLRDRKEIEQEIEQDAKELVEEWIRCNHIKGIDKAELRLLEAMIADKLEERA